MTQTAELSPKFREKIVAFIDGDHGLDAPLSAEDREMVQTLIERDPKAQQFAGELRSLNDDLDAFFDNVSAVELPEHLEDMIRAFGKGKVTALEPKHALVTASQSRLTNYRPLAVAASFVALLSLGALLYDATINSKEHAKLTTALNAAVQKADERSHELADARSEVQRLDAIAQQATDHYRLIADELTTLEVTNHDLSVEKATLEGHLAGLEGQIQQLAADADQHAVNLAEAEAARERLDGDLLTASRAISNSTRQMESLKEATRSEIAQLESDVAKKGQEILSLKDDLVQAAQLASIAEGELAEMRGAQMALASQLATTRAEIDRLMLVRDNLQLAAEDARQESQNLIEARDTLATRIENDRDRIIALAAFIHPDSVLASSFEYEGSGRNLVAL